MKDSGVVCLRLSPQKGICDDKRGVDAGDAHDAAELHMEAVGLVPTINHEYLRVGLVHLEQHPIGKEQVSNMTSVIMLHIPAEIISLNLLDQRLNQSSVIQSLVPQSLPCIIYDFHQKSTISPMLKHRTDCSWRNICRC